MFVGDDSKGAEMRRPYSPVTPFRQRLVYLMAVALVVLTAMSAADSVQALMRVL